MIPPGALDGSVKSSFGWHLSTTSPTDFAATEIILGEPIDDRLVIETKGNYSERYGWEPPPECADGCEVVIPVTIEQVGDGVTPRFGWSADFYVQYDGTVPASAKQMVATIEPRDATS